MITDKGAAFDSVKTLTMVAVETHGSGGHANAAALCDRSSAVGNHHASHHNDQLPLYGLAIVLIGGGVIQHFFSKVPLPYTVLLLIFGIALGAWVQFDPNYTLQPGMLAGEHSWGGLTLACNVTTYVPNDLHFHGWHLGNSLRQLGAMDPHLLLHVLLPPLLFESAFAIDFHIFRKVAAYALVLAGPGLALCTVLGGLTYIGLYGWTWEPAMLLAGILSATDPVAVVALLREMGVKKSLATLIEAESLLNDGTAVVVYAILLQAVRAGGLVAWLNATSTVGGWHILWVVVRMSIIGPLFGAALGVISVKWLEANSGADRDANVEVICTLAMPFLVFYLAETAFGETMQMSGVLAVVCYGLVFASPFGKVRIDPGVEHFLHEFWGMVGHLVNTLVFVLSGIIIVTSINWRSDTLGVDIGYGVLSYGLMGIYRGIVMFGVMPIFRRGHYGYTWQDALVISWGGLRGAVGLALAISVFLDNSIVDGLVFQAGEAIHFRQVVLVHTSLIVMLTLLVNAPSSAPILKMIGLTKLSNTRVSMLQLTQRELHKRVRGVLGNMMLHPVHSDVCWEQIQKLANFDEMVASILGQQYVFSPGDAWKPPAKDDTSVTKKHSSHGGAHHHVYETVGCRRRRKDSTEVMGAQAPSKAAGPVELSAERVAEAERRWKLLQAKLIATIRFAGNEFVADFKARLRVKRMNEAKYRLLEQIKACVWEMYESGQLRPFTAQRLKDLVMDQIDQLEAGRSSEVNPLPFAPLKSLLQTRPGVAKLASTVEVCAKRSVLLSPLAAYGNTMTFHEFERGYDATVGYLLAHEEVLASYDHGHHFSLDRSLDQQFKSAVKDNIKDAAKALAVLKLNWPKMCTALNTLKAARLVLNSGQDLVSELGHHGVLHETETERLLDLISASKSKLNLLSPVLALPVEERTAFFPSSVKVHTAAEIEAMQRRLTLRSQNSSTSLTIKTIGKIGSLGKAVVKSGTSASFKLARKEDSGSKPRMADVVREKQKSTGSGSFSKPSSKIGGVLARAKIIGSGADIEDGRLASVEPTPLQGESVE